MKIPYRSSFLALIILAFCAALWRMPAPLEHRFLLSRVSPADNGPLYEQYFSSNGITQRVHAPSIAELADGRLLAVWFAGSREGAKDVEIHGAYFDPSRGEWSADFSITGPKLTQQQSRRYIRKVGNPVVTAGPDGQLWLFYVSVSVGGWSTSQINLIRSDDLGVTWSPAQRLISSPAFNLSTLVKGTPYHYQDGTLGLPAYHEFAAKFGEILRISAAGEVIGKTRLADGKYSLQPVLLIRDELQADAFMRYAGEEPPPRVLTLSTSDGGESWSPPQKLAIPNPNSALAGLRDEVRMLLVLNNTEDERDRLSLEISQDEGQSWHTAYLFEDRSQYTKGRLSNDDFQQMIRDDLYQTLQPERQDQLEQLLAQVSSEACRKGHCAFQFDYPYMIRSRNGDYHLVYTWNRSLIKHVRFNTAWLEQLP